MRVLVLGASGSLGRRVSGHLNSDNLVSEIIVAGRNLEVARRCASEIGEKANAVSADISDADRLAVLAKESDIVVNAAGPEWEVVPKALSASIEAGTNYCDIGGDGPTLEKVLEMDPRAKSQRVTALLGIGYAPGLTNLMMVHAARQLDRVDEVRCCWFFPFWNAKNVLQREKDAGRVSASWQAIMKSAAPPFHSFRGGALSTVEGKTEKMEVMTPSHWQKMMPGYGKLPSVLAGTTETITLPRLLPGVREVHALFSFLPFGLNEAYMELGARIAKGELDESQAALSFLERAVLEAERDKLKESDFPTEITHAPVWAEAIGVKDGNRVKFACCPAGALFSTAATFSVAALKILKGEVKTQGVLAPESCLEPLPFLKEVARVVLKKEEPGKLLNEELTSLG